MFTDLLLGLISGLWPLFYFFIVCGDRFWVCFPAMARSRRPAAAPRSSAGRRAATSSSSTAALEVAPVPPAAFQVSTDDASPDHALDALLAVRPTRWRAQSRLPADSVEADLANIVTHVPISCLYHVYVYVGGYVSQQRNKTYALVFAARAQVKRVLCMFNHNTPGLLDILLI